MDTDETTLSTLSLLETRMLRVEQLLYGRTAPPEHDAEHEPAAAQVASLERRFTALVQHVRVYAELLKICLSPLLPL